MEEIRQVVSRRLKELRQNCTQGELARKAGVSIDVIGKIEREETTPSLETLHRLCQALHVSLSEFFTPETKGEEVAEILERLRRYLSVKRADQVEFADQLVRLVIDRLEAEGRSKKNHGLGEQRNRKSV